MSRGTACDERSEEYVSEHSERAGIGTTACDERSEEYA